MSSAPTVAHLRVRLLILRHSFPATVHPSLSQCRRKSVLASIKSARHSEGRERERARPSNPDAARRPGSERPSRERTHSREHRDRSVYRDLTRPSDGGRDAARHKLLAGGRDGRRKSDTPRTPAKPTTYGGPKTSLGNGSSKSSPGVPSERQKSSVPPDHDEIPSHRGADYMPRAIEATNTYEYQDPAGEPPPIEDDLVDTGFVPESVPYTTAASTFLYGHNVVYAALKAKRRKIYALHVQKSMVEDSRGVNIRRLALSVPSIKVNLKANSRLLSSMSNDRPHNGFALEVSPLPAAPVVFLHSNTAKDPAVRLNVDSPSPGQDLDTRANSIPMAPNSWRRPLIVMLDGILDPQNLGNIIRTCHFFAVDAVAICKNTCTDVNSPIVAKASSGACEVVRILTVDKPSNFLRMSSRHGWKIWGSVSPPKGDETEPVSSKRRHTSAAAIPALAPLTKDPCILILGGEGEGIGQTLLNKVDNFVTVYRPQHASGMDDIGVDSINVGVAAGVLLSGFLKKPAEGKRLNNEWRPSQVGRNNNLYKRVVS